MEPSLSLDPNIVLRSSQGEMRGTAGAWSSIRRSGAMRPDVAELADAGETPLASLARGVGPLAARCRA